MLFTYYMAPFNPDVVNFCYLQFSPAISYFMYFT